MATTARALPPNLEVSGTDDMDLHSDSGLDFGDGDVELDLEPTPSPSVHRQDDDMSINDAPSVSEPNVYTVPADQDDFMADHGDFVEEDYGYQADDGITATGQSSNNDTATAQTETLGFADDDIIDYSDDFGQPPHENQTLAAEQDQDEASPLDHDQVEQGIGINIQSEEVGAFEARGDDRSSADSDELRARRDHVFLVDSSDRHLCANDHQSSEDEVSHEEDVSPEEDVILDYDDPEEYDGANTAAGNEDEQNRASDLQPITVNYAGNELWLFKQHDTDDSGDWLIDQDLSLAKSSMADLFHGCRASLGDDVSTEHELGFRFDHLHNLELYEDNTACVAVSLERLVGLYHTLQAQDDNSEPESFYLTLLFRPRFATLLSDVAKYAEQGSGYSGLDAAVAAGETHFSNIISGSSTEHEPNEWDNEDGGETDGDKTEETDGQTHQEAGQTEHDKQEPQTQVESEEEHDKEDEYANEGTPVDGSVPQELQEQDHHDSNHDTPLQPVNTSDVPSNEQLSVGQPGAQLSLSHSESAVETDARREQRDDDLIDYSDDEDAEDTNEVEHASFKAPSPSSSTVQGDEATNLEEDSNTAGSPDQNVQGNSKNDEDENNAQFNDQLVEGTDDATQSYENHTQAFDQDDPFQDFQTDGDANQDYVGFESEALDQQLDFLSGAEFDAGNNSTLTGDDFTGTDDFLDLDAHEWATEQELVSNLSGDVIIVHDDVTTQVDEEDGVAEHSAVAVSSTADPATASSIESQKLSPQGHKRSIDEAGHGVDNALDSIDAKRPKV